MTALWRSSATPQEKRVLKMLDAVILVLSKTRSEVCAMRNQIGNRANQRGRYVNRIRGRVKR